MAWLLDTSMGPPGPAGAWPLWLSLTFHLSNLTLGLTYLLIPVIKHAYWPYRGTGISDSQYWKIMAYLPMMALSRFVRVAEIWGPPYHLTTIVDALAAVTAVYSFYHIQSWFRHILTLPSVEERDELRAEVARLNAERIGETEDRARRTWAVFKRLDSLQRHGIDDYETLVSLAEIRALMLDPADSRATEAHPNA